MRELHFNCARFDSSPGATPPELLADATIRVCRQPKIDFLDHGEIAVISLGVSDPEQGERRCYMTVEQAETFAPLLADFIAEAKLQK